MGVLLEVVGRLSIDGECDWRVPTVQCCVAIVVQELMARCVCDGGVDDGGRLLIENNISWSIYTYPSLPLMPIFARPSRLCSRFGIVYARIGVYSLDLSHVLAHPTRSRSRYRYRRYKLYESANGRCSQPDRSDLSYDSLSMFV